MSLRELPARPSLEHLKKEAETNNSSLVRGVLTRHPSLKSQINKVQNAAGTGQAVWQQRAASEPAN